MIESNSLNQQILKILTLILKQNFSDDACPKREDCPTWDSLNHVEIVILLEEEFSVRFTGEEVATLNSFEEIRQVILRKKNEPLSLQ